MIFLTCVNLFDQSFQTCRMEKDGVIDDLFSVCKLMNIWSVQVGFIGEKVKSIHVASLATLNFICVE